MSTIDERIVSMVFDNSRFQKNIEDTQQSLVDLDDEISKASGNASKNFLNIENGFSRLDVMMAGFYSKIGGYLADLTLKAGKFAKSLTFDQVSEGFNKYTAETLAVQTITSNTNNTLEHTYDILGDILDYTDKTSYHYDTMTNTIAKFANQGVALEDAAQATKGIANWAAISGAGIEKADITMNAMIKSMASGNMQMREWRTISQVANMGTVQFKETLIETAKELAKQGKASKDWNKITLQNFEDAEDGVFGKNKLLTSNVLMATLQKYGDETSELGKKALAAASEAKTFKEAIDAVKDAVSTGFGTSFREIFGNYEEAKKVWTGVQDAMLEVFTLGQEYRNQVLHIWHNREIGGYKDMLQSISDIWSGLKNLVTPVGDAMKQVFEVPDVVGMSAKLEHATKKVKAFGDTFKRITSGESAASIFEVFSGENVNTGLSKDRGKVNFKDSISGPSTSELTEKVKAWDRVASIIESTRSAFTNIAKTVKNVIGIFKQFKDGLKGTFSGVGDVVKQIAIFVRQVTNFTSSLTSAIKQSGIFGSVARSLSKIINSLLKPAFEFITGLLSKFGSTLDEQADGGLVTFRDKLAKVGETIENVADFLVNKGITPAVQKLGGAFKWLGERLTPIKDLFDKAKEGLTNFFGKFKDKDGEKINVFSKILDGLGKALQFVWGIIKKVAGTIKQGLSDVFGEISFGNMANTGMFAFMVVGIKKLSESLGNLKENLNPLTGISGKIKETVETIKGLFSGKQDQTSEKVKQLKDMAIALLLLAGAMILVASVDTEKMAASFGILSGLIGEMAGILVLLNTIGNGKKSKDVTKPIIKLAAGVLILALALKAIASIDSDKLLGATIALEVILLSLTGIAMALSSDKSQKMMKGSSALIAMAIAVRILASSVKVLGDLSIEELAKGLISVVVLLGSIVAFAALTKNLNLKGFGLQLILMATGLRILVTVVKALGQMDTKQLVQGLIATTVAITGIGAALRLFPKGTMAIGAGLILVAAGLKIITKILKSLAEMSIEDLAKSIIALTGALALLGLDLKLMKGSIGGAAAMLVMSAALVIFAGAIKLIAAIPLLDLIKAVGTLVITFGALALLAPVLGAAAVPLLAFGGAIALLGVGVAALAAGLLALTTAGAGAMLTMQLFLTTLIGLIPNVIIAIGEGFIGILGIIAASGKEIVAAVTTVITAILDALIEVIPKAVELVVTLVTALLDALIELFPKIVEAGVTLILSLLQGIADAMPDIIKAAVDIVVNFLEGLGKELPRIVDAGFKMIINFLNGIAKAIEENTGDLMTAGWNILTAIVKGITDGVKKIWSKIKEVGGDLIKSIKEGLEEKVTAIKDWFLGIPGKIKDWIKEKWEKAKEAGKNLIEGIKNGLTGGEGSLGDKIKSIGSGLLSKFKSILGIHSPSTEFEGVGKNIMKGINEGLDKGNKGKSSPLSKIASIGSGLLSKFKNVLGIKSPSKEMAIVGKYIDLGLVKGIEDYSKLVNKSAEALGDGTYETIKDGLSAISGIDFGEESDPVIKPVLDLSNIESGSRDISRMLDGNYGVRIAGAFNPNKGYGMGNSNTYAPTINMTINGAEGQDVNQLADIISRKINQSLKSRERVWA